jgi:hypothetical protein
MSQPLYTARHALSKETRSEPGPLPLRVWSRPPACPSSGNIPGFPGGVHPCSDNNFHKICSLFSIRYTPILPAAPNSPVTLVVGRFMRSSTFNPIGFVSHFASARKLASTFRRELGSFRCPGESPSEAAHPRSACSPIGFVSPNAAGSCSDRRPVSASH